MTKDKQENLKVLTINIPQVYNDIICLLKDSREYPSKTEVVRTALRDFFIKEKNLINILYDKKNFKPIIPTKKEKFVRKMNKKVIKVLNMTPSNFKCPKCGNPTLNTAICDDGIVVVSCNYKFTNGKHCEFYTEMYQLKGVETIESRKI